MQRRIGLTSQYIFPNIYPIRGGEVLICILWQESFDFIHVRNVAQGISDWPKLMGEIFRYDWHFTQFMKGGVGTGMGLTRRQMHRARRVRTAGRSRDDSALGRRIDGRRQSRKTVF